ncbi:CHAT domain-containing tetratricopeptide repeat protein [Dokdonia sp.]|uniref:CHAT domain-containing protein n=1 Tax=Dokdonia sp. TaxID=2024995 RepID=UPI003263D1A5
MRGVREIPLISFLCLFTLPIWPQDSPTTYIDSITALQITNDQKELQIERYFSSLPEDTPYLEDAYYEYSKWCFLYNGDHEKGQLYGRMERVLRLKKHDSTADKTKRNLYNLGYFYYNSDNPKPWKSKAYYDTLVSISKDHEVRLGRAYGELGLVYDKWGDFQNALEHFLLSEQILREKKYYNQAVKVLNNILAMYVELNDATYLNDFIQIKKKIETYNKSDISSSTKAKIIYNTAAMYLVAGLLEDAEKNALKSFESYKSLGIPNNIFNSIILLGVIETKKNNFNKARDYFNQAYTYTEDKKVPLSNISNNLGSLDLEMGNYERALEHYYDAISLISKGDTLSPRRQLPIQTEISISPDKKQLFSYLYDLSKAWIIYYEKDQKEEYLLEALKVLKYADATIDELFLESQEELSKLDWRKKASHVYMDAIKTAYLLNKPEVALYYMEKKKGLLLLENTTEILAKQRANIPQYILEKEEVILSDIRKHLNSLTDISSTEMQSEATEIVKKDLFSLKNKYRKFIDSIEVLYPVYVNTKKQLNISSLKDIQKTLKADEQVIDYALGDSLGYVMLITKNDIQFKQIPTSLSDLRQQIDEFQNTLIQPLTNTQEIANYKKAATNLSQVLLPFKRFRESGPQTALIIIPDGMIQKVPFEALTISEELHIPKTYFISSYTITYKYSHSLDEHIAQLRPANNNSISFLPTDFINSYLTTLPFSTKEAKGISNYYQDHTYTHEMASKELFLTEFDNNAIIHISTHGGTDSDGPWLAFYDSKLRLEELYSPKNRKELVVLSACKTDVGDIKKGEGVFSIKRGFFKAGARSVISTLWDVNEKANMEIITGFYKEIASGKKKSQALRNAKLSYLKKHANTSETSPYYWSGITLTGHDSTIDLGVTSTIYLWIFSLSILLIILFLLFKKRLRK